MKMMNDHNGACSAPKPRKNSHDAAIRDGTCDQHVYKNTKQSIALDTAERELQYANANLKS